MPNAERAVFGICFHDVKGMIMKTDTIAAIATGLSEAGIGIIRVSGENAINTVDRIFFTGKGQRILTTVKSHTIHYGYIVADLKEDDFCHEKDVIPSDDIPSDWKKGIIDEVMVSVMRAPHSYTAEDTVEINCHGGILVVRRVLEAVLAAGARLAEPGEFTKRAFLNGRIDLTKAEAVMDVIHSQSELALSSSMDQLKGNLSEKIKNLRAEVLYEIAFIESALDDPEHISLDGYREKLSAKIEGLKSEIYKLIQSADQGKLMKEGINTVIVGKPNVGKSSFLNLLLGEERAIVTDIAGTTRDVLQESIILRGIGLNVVDTAGIRNTEDKIEQIGVERAIHFAQKADLIIFLIDASVPLDKSDREICSLIEMKNTIILLNKTDLNCVVEEKDILQMLKEEVSEEEKWKDVRIIKISALDQTGIDDFEKTVEDMFFQGRLSSEHEVVITNLRHKEALQQVYEDLEMVEKSISDEMPEDFYSIDLMDAYAALGRIIGEEVGEDLVNEIFSKFCMGK